jgi:molybdate transport system regulatory protein
MRRKFTCARANCECKFESLQSRGKPGNYWVAFDGMAMSRQANLTRVRSLQPRFRVYRGRDVALGPGKVELLALIKRTGSIGRAAKHMNMSYMRAWSLIQAMNRCFKEPLVRTTHGGEGGGGAELTGVGRRMLALYRQMEKQSAAATKATWKDIRSHLKP